MKLNFPIYGYDIADSVTQYFGVNADVYQKKFDIPGHSGQDIRVKYGDPVLAMHDGIVERLSYDIPHATKGNGIYLMTDDGQYTSVYWHLSAFQCNIGDKIRTGQIIGLAGNSGFVFPKPTPQNPWLGAHLHVGIRKNGYQNEYKGYIDPTPFLYREGRKLKMKFTKNIWWGSTGDEVSYMQTILTIEGYAQDYEPIGYAGGRTIRDVRLLQQKYKISPAHGLVGPVTRKFLEDKYCI